METGAVAMLAASGGEAVDGGVSDVGAALTMKEAAPAGSAFSTVTV